MKRQHAGRIIPLAALLALGWASAGSAQGTGKKVGEKLDEVGREIKGGLGRAGDAAKEQYGRAKQSVQNMSVEARIYGRIHWDKALNDALIDLTVTSDGAVTMTGSVADAKAKARAVELARETVGVTKVVDTLAIRPAPATSGP